MTIYLEEEVTKNVEFPSDGKFTNIQFGRYKCCGDHDEVDEMQHTSAQPKSWSLPRPWKHDNPSWSNTSGPSSSGPFQRSKKMCQPYEVFLKRSIPYVALGLDHSGRNIIVDGTINNIYIKIPENTVSAQAILSAMATKIGCEVAELVILDVKFLEVSDDKGN